MARTQAISITDALLQVSQAINAETDVVKLLAAIKAIAVQVIEAERASVFILDKSHHELWTLLADGEDMIRLPSGKGIVGSVIESNTSVAIEDASRDPRFYREIDRQTGYETRSVLCAPMRNRDGVARGAIELLNKRGGAFTDEDRRVLAILGNQAGLAVEHVEMRDEVRRNLTQLQALLEIQQDCTFAMEREEIFETVLSILVRQVEGRWGALYICFGDGKDAYYGFRPGAGLESWESDENRAAPEYITDIKQGIKAAREGTRPGSDDLACAPLSSDGKSFGYLAIRLHSNENRLFNAVSTDYIALAAAQIASILVKKEALEQRKREEKLLLLGSMLATIVHDMKSPLSGISGYAQLIRHRSGEEKTRLYCDSILRALEHVETMNRELLAFVRGEYVGLKRSSVDLRGLLAEIVDSAREGDKYQGVTTRLAEGDAVTVQADRDRLVRVFNNILANAREAMPDGGNIEISVDRIDSRAVVIISDDGVGMPAHIRDRVFEPFITYGKQKGTGLGLTAVRTLIEEHGGAIGVTSALGKGTAFTIHLPINTSEED